MSVIHSDASTAIVRLLNLLVGVRRSPGGWIARCPAHDDGTASLSISQGTDGCVLVCCHAGCPIEAITAAIGLTVRDLFNKTAPRGDRPIKRPARGGGRRLPDVGVSAPTWTKLTSDALSAIDHECRDALTAEQLTAWTDRFRLSARSSLAFGLGRYAPWQAFTFPMFDVAGEIIGIRTRHDDGSKRCLIGSRLGLFVAADDTAVLDRDTLLIAEGESDAIAARDLGFRAIGVPGCGNCPTIAVDFVKRSRPTRLVVIADADKPGQDGARQLARELVSNGIGLRLFTPPGAKDLRAWKALPGSDHHAFAALLDAPADRMEVLS